MVSSIRSSCRLRWCRRHGLLVVHPLLKLKLHSRMKTRRDEVIMNEVSLSAVHQAKDEWRGTKVWHQLYLKLSLLATISTHSSSLRWQRLVSVAHYSVSLVSIHYSSESSRWQRSIRLCLVLSFVKQPRREGRESRWRLGTELCSQPLPIPRAFHLRLSWQRYDKYELILLSKMIPTRLVCPWSINQLITNEC